MPPIKLQYGIFCHRTYYHFYKRFDFTIKRLNIIGLRSRRSHYLTGSSVRQAGSDRITIVLADLSPDGWRICINWPVVRIPATETVIVAEALNWFRHDVFNLLAGNYSAG